MTAFSQVSNLTLNEAKLALAKCILQKIQVQSELDSCEQTRSDLEQRVYDFQEVALAERATADSLRARADYQDAKIIRITDQNIDCEADRASLKLDNANLTAENQRRKTGGRIFKGLTLGLTLLLIIK